MIAAARPPLWTPQYALSLVSTFFFFSSFFYLLSVLPDYVDSIGGAEWQIGLVVGLYSVIPLAIRLFVGRWCDAGRRLRLMRAGIAAFVIAFVLMVFSEDVASLIVLRIVQGAGMAMFPTAAGSMVAEIVPLSRRGEGLGFFGMSTSLAQMAAPAIGVLIADTWGFDAVFLTGAATTAATLLLIAPLREPPPRPAADLVPVKLLPVAAIFPTLVFLSVTLAFSAASSFLPLLADDRGLGNPGLFFLIGGAASVLTRPLTGRTSDRVGRIPVILPGLVATAASMVVLAGAQAPITMLAAGALAGLGLGAAHTGLFALSIDRVAPSMRGGATAVFQMAWDIGGFLGGVVLGLVAEALELDMVFWAAAIFAGVAVVTLLLGRALGWTRPLPAAEVVREAVASG